MIVPTAGQGGVTTRAGVPLQEDSGYRPLLPLTMEQIAKVSSENSPQHRHQPVLAWQHNADECSASSIESLPGTDMVYPASDVSLSMVQKLRGIEVHNSYSTAFSEDEDVPDMTLDGSPRVHYKRRMHVGHPLALSSVSVNTDEVAMDQLSTKSEEYPFHRVKLLCSSGGKIFPRPSDGQLRYVGGDTRLITVNRDISYSELMVKMMEFYPQARMIKYKLPEEDLDALVSVSSNEDLANMMEEYDKLEATDQSPRLRLFLFSDVEYDSLHLNESLGDQRNSEQRYVDAVNGIPETGSRKHSEAGSVSVITVVPHVVENLIDVDDVWTFGRSQESAPLSRLTTAISQDDVTRKTVVPLAIPVSSVPTPVTFHSNLNAPYAPPSAPSSPPPLPRGLKQMMVPEPHLPYFSDQHGQMSAHVYNVGQSDGSSLDTQSFGGSMPSGANVHEHPYMNPDPRRGAESPSKLHHEGALFSGQQEHVPRDELRHVPEVPMIWVPSHGKLTRLADHHSEGTSSARQRNSYHQPQLQGGWPPHVLEVQLEGYKRRAELFQPNADSGMQPTLLGQQQHPVHFCSQFQSTLPLPPPEPIYRPVDHQSQGEEIFAPFMHRSVSAHAMGPPLGSAAASSYNVGVGSAPTSPRLAFRDSSSRYSAGQSQLQSHSQPVQRAYAGPNFNEQQQRRYHPHTETSSRLRPSNSPPRYRDHLGHTDDRILLQPHQQPASTTSDALQQEQFLSDALPQEHFVSDALQQEQFLYEVFPKNQYVDGVGRSQLSQYLGHNPFQDSPSGFPNPGLSELEDGDGRRHPFLGNEEIAQPPYHPPQFNTRLEYQENDLPSAEPLLDHSQFSENSTDWVLHQHVPDTEETRLRLAVRGRPGQSELLDEVVGVESNPSQNFDTAKSVLHLPEDSDALLAQAVADSHLHRQVEWVEQPVISSHSLRSGITQSSALPVHPSSVNRGDTDSSQVPLHVASDLYPEPAPRPGMNLQDSNIVPRLSDVNVRLLPSVTNFNVPAAPSPMDNRAVTGAFSHMVPQLSSYAAGVRLGNIEPVNDAEMQWGGLIDSDDFRVEGLLHSRDPISKQDRSQQLSGVGGSQGCLSRSLSGTAIDSHLEDISQGVQTRSVTAQGNCNGAEDDSVEISHNLHNLAVRDGVFPSSGQVPFSIGQTQVPSPPTSRLAVPSRSVEVSTEISIPTLPIYSSALETSMSIATSLPEQVPSSMGSLLFKPAVETLEGEVGESSEWSGGPEKEENKRYLSQLSATGHLAEDMVSSVLSPMVPLQTPNMQEGKVEWVPVSQDAAVLIQAPLLSSPTFAMQNWEKSLAALGAEEEDEEDEAVDVEPVSEKQDLEVHFSTTKLLEEPTGSGPAVKEPIAEFVGSNKEDPEKKTSSNLGTASEAEAEAISRGLQTILNADLEEMRELGSGTFGTVYHGKWRGTDVAIKRIKASCFAGRPAERDRLIADFWREACTLSLLHHPNVVAFYGVVRDGPGGTLATVTEYMVNGSLKQVLHKKDRTIDRRKRLLIAMDAAFGMEYLHNKNIVHFDLKCDNLLVNMRDPHRPICKVGDLGLSKVKHQTMVSGGVRGTLPWMAPELLNGSSSMVTEKVDVFSFGIVMWELLTGEEPYANMHYGAIIGGIVNNTLRPQIPTWCDPLWKSLMERCWSAEPASRPSFSDVASELRVMAASLQPKPHV